MIKPTIGRIIYYHEKGRDEPYPAVLLTVLNDRLVVGLAFHSRFPYAHLVQAQLLQDDDQPTEREWFTWMEYQKGQAAKTDSTEQVLKNATAYISELNIAIRELSREFDKLENDVAKLKAARKEEPKAKADGQQEAGR